MVTNAFAGVIYQLEQIDSSRWKYSYQIQNDQPNPIEALTIWFDEDLYSDLQIESTPQVQTAWDEIILVSIPGTGHGYDILSETGGIDAGQFADGFAVSFDWLGSEIPGQQPFEVLDPVTFETTYQGVTIPEPATISFLVLAAVLLRATKRK